MVEQALGQPQGGAANMVALLRSIMRWALEILAVDTGEIYLWDPEQGALVLRVACGSSIEVHLGISLGIGEGLAGKVFESGEPTIVDDYRSWEGRSEAIGEPMSCSELGVPLIFGSRTIGVLTFATDADRRTFSEGDVRLSVLCANLAAVAIENARLYEQLRESVVRLRRTLEEEVSDRMSDLVSRAIQTETGSVFAPESTSSPTIDELLGRVMELRITRKVLDEITSLPTDSHPVDPFTPREVEVLGLIAKGFSNKEIALHLSIALSTVKFHVSSILSKLHVSDRTRAALWAVDRGLVPPGESLTPTND